MPLVLRSSFDELSRKEIEQHLELVRARRLQGAVLYHKAQSAKLERDAGKIDDKIVKQYELLGKELTRLDKLGEKVQARMETLTNLLNELGLVEDLIEGEQ